MTRAFLRSLRWSAAVVATGVGAGAAGMVLVVVLHAVQHLAYGYDHGAFGTGVDQAPALRRVLAMALGGLLVGLGWWALRRWTRPVVEADAAVRDLRTPLRLPTTAADALLQVAAVGFGASLGREGAPRQIGAALAGWFARRGDCDPSQQRTLIACGAGAGLAAVYNVPLGGALFSLEVLLGALVPGAVVPAVVTAVIATVVARPVIGDQHTYAVGTFPAPSAPLVVGSLLLGPLAGLVGVAFRSLATCARARPPQGWRLPVATTVSFGVIGALAVVVPEVLGNGRAPAELAFVGQMGIGTASVLLVARPLATAACLRAGARGGLLTPAVALGAVLGALGGAAWAHVWPGAPGTAFAVIGAAAVLAVTQRAPLTAVVLLLELTGTASDLVVPMLLAVGGASATAGLFGARPRLGGAGAHHRAGAAQPQEGSSASSSPP